MQLEELTASTARAYKSLVHPKHLELLDHINGSSVWGFGASNNNQPAGIVLGRSAVNEGQAKIIELVVAEGHQRRGMGMKLLWHAEQKMREQGISDGQFAGFIKAQDFSWLSKIAIREGWQLPKVKTYMYTLGSMRLGECQWVERLELPKGFTLFPWKDLTPAERLEIKKGEGQWYTSLLSPFFEEGKFDPDYSTGLRYQGKVIGWVIVQRLASNLLLYKAMHVQKKYQQKARGIALLMKTIAQAQPTFPFGMCFVAQENEAMLWFMEKRLGPTILQRKLWIETNKVLARQYADHLC
ncbi:GNAT family N-acetyltransferase [Brevibacillus sp. IT-7CA2]|uniref:GNAT family N-acetyltransferase n=1 Tax=Brevibacillus sp. IT-7CA2 TaxID=3026436 RepID=UPI0039E06C15